MTVDSTGFDYFELPEGLTGRELLRICASQGFRVDTRFAVTLLLEMGDRPIPAIRAVFSRSVVKGTKSKIRNHQTGAVAHLGGELPSVFHVIAYQFFAWRSKTQGELLPFDCTDTVKWTRCDEQIGTDSLFVGRCDDEGTQVIREMHVQLGTVTGAGLMRRV